MVARNESMFGCYSDSYSYRLWSLANVWSSCQLPPLPAGSDKPLPSACSSVSDGEDAPPAAAPPGGRGRRSPPLPLGPGGPYTCPQCGGAYPSKELLEKHELLHSPNTQSCKICNKSFANVYRLQRHMISHDESALLRKFKCNDCDKAFKFKHHLKEHLRIHSGEKPFECGNCRKKFSHSGSYSSHMTSKKCLVMNLKMGRIRPNNPALNPVRSPSRKRASSAISQINNNTTPNNNNSYLPILPKYNDATTAFLASLAPRDGFSSSPSPLSNPAFQSLYLSGNIPLHHLGGVPPYNPAITNLLEHFAASQLLPRKLDSDIIHKGSGSSHSDPEDMIEEVTEDEDKRSSIGDERELVMDIEDEEPVRIKEEVEPERIVTPKNLTPSYAERQSPSANSNSGDLGGFKRILDNVNATVTKHMLQANMNKLSPDCARSCHSIPSPPVPVVPIKPDPDDVLQCTRCHITFNHKAELLQHEQVLCGQLFRKHEGLAAQMAETVALNRIEEEIHASINSGMSGSEDEDYSKDTDGKMRQDNERKVRVRTAISDEQQAILKEHYARNQRPNREEFRRIAQRLGLDNRVVQVWFQNNRARVRRMNQSHTFSEQPLDLSTKKSTNSTTSSPSASPLCNASHSDFGEEAVNLSQKSSRSPTPYRQSFQSHYQHSNCSSSSLADMRHSPSPSEALMMNGPRRLLHSQYKINPNSCHAPPPVYSPDMTASHSPLMNNHLGSDLGRASSSSPGSERRSWTEESRVSQDIDGDEPSLKKVRLKGPGDSKEPEGQFVCDQCDKAFVKQSSLARHKYEHSGQRPYKCVECPKAFKHKHHLTEHKRLHTGEKPFQCCKCLKKFSHSGSYSQHMNHRYSYCKPYRE